MSEDFPGLLAAVGSTAFERLCEGLSGGLSVAVVHSCAIWVPAFEDWLLRNPRYAGTAFGLALDMVRLEWAHIEAFDGGARQGAWIGRSGRTWGRAFALGIQPHLQLLSAEVSGG